MSLEFTGEAPSVQQAGASLEIVSKLAQLGLVLQDTHYIHLDGATSPVASFTFMPDSPLGRANIACGTDVDILDGIIIDAKILSHDQFAARFPNFGPYDTL